MDKLEYLSPYLPYRLKGSNHNGIDVDLTAMFLSNVLGGRMGFTPHLRPLSDYFKMGLNGFSEEDMKYMKLIIKGDTHHYGNISYGCIIWLLENHYDIYNLIIKGLAIDINTLNQ